MRKATCLGGPCDGQTVALNPGTIGYAFTFRDRRGYYFERPYMPATNGERGVIHYIGPRFPSRYRERARWDAKLRRWAREEARATGQ